METDKLNLNLPNGTANYQGPGQYLHYKGGEYQVHGIALQENTVPKDNAEGSKPVFFVIYSPLTAGSLLEQYPDVEFWARELSDFNVNVECTTFHDADGNEYEEEGGYLVRRFVKIPDIDHADLVWAVQGAEPVRVSLTHKPSGIVCLAEDVNKPKACYSALSELRRNLARKNASV